MPTNLTRTDCHVTGIATVVIPNLRRNCRRAGQDKIVYRFIFMQFHHFIDFCFQEVVSETGGAWDGTLPEVWYPYGWQSAQLSLH
jgi:hypothetical protein